MKDLQARDTVRGPSNSIGSLLPTLRLRIEPPDLFRTAPVVATWRAVRSHDPMARYLGIIVSTKNRADRARSFGVTCPACDLLVGKHGTGGYG